MPLTVDLEAKESVLCIRLAGELDHHTAETLRSEITKITEEQTIQHMILNMEHLALMDSPGLGVILGRYNYVHQRGGEMVICGISPTVKRLFEISGMFKILRLEPNERLALFTLGVA